MSVRSENSSCDSIGRSCCECSCEARARIDLLETKLKAEEDKNVFLEESLINGKEKSSDSKNELNDLRSDLKTIKRRYFKVFKHVCPVRNECEYRTYRKDYLESHMKTCRKKGKLSRALNRGDQHLSDESNQSIDADGSDDFNDNEQV